MTLKRKAPTMFSDEEVEVSGILLQLPRLIFSSMSWGAKRKRTAAVEPPLSSPVHKLKPSSPSTPLSFCPSESDEKPFKLPKQIIKTPEGWSKKFQEHLKKIKSQELQEQKLLRQCEHMLKSILANKATSPELRPEEQVPQLDLEMRLGLPAINRDEQEPQNNVQQQNQQQITMEVEVIKEETIMMMGNNEAYLKTLPLFSGGGLRDTEMPRRHVNAIPQGYEFCSSMDSIISRLKAKRARQWRLKVIRENRSNLSTRLKFSKS